MGGKKRQQKTNKQKLTKIPVMQYCRGALGSWLVALGGGGVENKKSAASKTPPPQRPRSYFEKKKKQQKQLRKKAKQKNNQRGRVWLLDHLHLFDAQSTRLSLEVIQTCVPNILQRKLQHKQRYNKRKKGARCI